MKNLKSLFVVLLIGSVLLTFGCKQNVDTPATSGRGWEKVGVLSEADLLDIQLISGQPAYRYVGYHSEPNCLSDFPNLLVQAGYSQSDVMNAIACYKSMQFRLNDTGLSPNVKNCMNEGQYPILLFLLMDNSGNIKQVLINKKSLGSFYTGAMQINYDGTWTDITSTLQ